MDRRDEGRNVFVLRRKPMGYAMRGAVLRHSIVRLRVLAATASVVWAATMCPAFAQVTETVLYSFKGGSDGGTPYAPLIADLSGPYGAPRALYGTTGFGGAITAPHCINNPGESPGCGTVFKLTPTAYGQTPWTETVLGSFSGGSTGDLPFAGLFARKESSSQTASLYGTTFGGFSGQTGGTVFRVTGQTLTTIYNFTGGSDGSNSQAALISDEAADGTGGALWHGFIGWFEAMWHRLQTDAPKSRTDRLDRATSLGIWGAAMVVTRRLRSLPISRARSMEQLLRAARKTTALSSG
jgi:hypothetical protein